MHVVFFFKMWVNVLDFLPASQYLYFPRFFFYFFQFLLKCLFTMASLRHILMGRNGDYFLNYIDYSKHFDAVLKLLLVI